MEFSRLRKQQKIIRDLIFKDDVKAVENASMIKKRS